MPIALNLFSSKVLFTVSILITSYSYNTVTTYKSILAILVLPTNSKIIAVINIAFSSILLT